MIKEVVTVYFFTLFPFVISCNVTRIKVFCFFIERNKKHAALSLLVGVPYVNNVNLPNLKSEALSDNFRLHASHSVPL
jgi:hypothetical protein